MSSTDLCYTGFGARKSGNHTQQEFLDVMDTHYGVKCPEYIKTSKCKVCKEYSKQIAKNIIKQIIAHKQKKTYKISKRNEASIVKLRKRCDKSTKKNTRKCSLKEYIEFSGAEPGPCS